ncbi:MAG: DNA repair protein RadA [Candidatus Lambdaproteobacteria bacterium RIFOXYD2_FULL_50_16]|uniref:DNA repair protein RadA n=1 Tax=Candidatus Lambdaproteobacteria bacterium RIFOXYD2_FULL_50_16 TaxID=1817772 RepID=A0A1F6GBP0_9PROT|nr:MAG: DNA repair protein RadA [Candidatus Lambdaproteobacteria bacterium RIFOXYD2_FULL_50_16]
MSKTVKKFVCEKCGQEHLQWSGRCTACGTWNSLVEESKVASPKGRQTSWLGERAPISKLGEIDSSSMGERWQTGVAEFDRVIGGGVLPGSFGLLGGTPGVGKSTLILQLMARIASLGKEVLYISGEESAGQIKERANRLAVDQSQIQVLCESNLEEILGHLERERPQFVVVDSIQTLFSVEFPASPGSVTQVRESAALLMRFAKAKGAAVMLIGHVTKDGTIAGPKTLEHMVDYVLYLEGVGEPGRLLRSVKNRFGNLSEIGLFKMTPKGLAELANPNQLFLEQFHWGKPGMAIFANFEGSRTLFMEVQVLVGDTEQRQPARMAVGLERNRLQVMVAVMEKHLGLDLSGNDVYLNLAGGFRVGETAIDMAVVAALLSSHLNKPLPERSVFAGELALTGEFRVVPGLEERASEAERCGFTKFYLPQRALARLEKKGVRLEMVGIDTLDQLMRQVAETL